MFIEGVRTWFTVIEMLLLAAVGVVVHERLLVNTHEIPSPFASDDVVYVLLFVPTLVPFFFH